MTNVGNLNLVLTANSDQLRQELAKVRQESQTTGSAIANLFSGDTINAVGFRVARTTVIGLINDLDELNNGLTLTESLTRNVAAGFADLGDIALLQLGQVAQFLGDELFVGPLAELQQASLDRVGLGQLSGAFQIVDAGVNISKLAEPALAGLTVGFGALDAVLGSTQTKAQGISDFFKIIAEGAELAGTVIRGVSDIIDIAVDKIVDSLAAVSPEFALARNAVKELGLEFSVSRAIFGEYADDTEKLKRDATSASQAFEAIASGAGEAKQGIAGASAITGDFLDKLQRQRRGFELFNDGIRELAEAGNLFDVWREVSTIFDGFFGSIEDSFVAAEQSAALAERLQLTSKSARGAGEELSFLGDLTKDLGLDFNATAEGYAQFSAAAQLSNLSAEETRDIFQDVAESAAVMRLSTAELDGIFLALRQSLSGGNVQLEELNQLAERIPGAFQAAEAALRQLGYTSGSVRDIISTGTVDSEQFITAFASQLSATTQSGLVGAANSGTAAIARFNNALGELQIEMGQAWLEVGTPALNTFAEALEFAAKNEELFSTAIDAILVASVFRGLSAVGKFTQALFNGGAAINLFGQQVKLTAAQIGGYALQAGLAYAATILFYRNLDRVRDPAKETRTAIASLERSLSDLSDSADDDSLGNLVQVEPVPTDFIDAAIFKINDLNAGINRFLGFNEDLGAITTNAEKQLNDQLIAIGDFSSRVQDIVGESINIRSLNVGGPINELKRIDAELARIEQRRLGATPDDVQLLESLKQQEEELLRTRAAAQEQIGNVQSDLANALTQAEQQLQNLDITALGSEGYERAKSELEIQIALIKQEQTAFNDLANSAVSTAETIADNFKQSSQELETSFLNQQVAIAEALAAGQIDEDQARQSNLEAERAFLEERVRLNQEKAEEIRAELERNAKAVAIDPAAATLSTEDQEKLEEQLLQIERETGQARIQIAQSITESLRDEENKRLEAQREAQEKALELFELANRRAEAEIAKSQSDRILAIRQSQLQGALSAEDAARQIEQIESDAIAETIRARQNQLAEIDRLRREGVLTAEEAASREIDLNAEIGQLNIRRLEAEIEARRRAAEEQISLQFAPVQLQLNARGDQLDIAGGALQAELELLNAQADLQSSLAQLEESRLQTRIAEAEATGNSAQAEQLKQELSALQSEQLERQFAIQKQQLDLQQQIRDTELERQLINSQIAETEAQINLVRAQSEGASQQELANLERILQLRQQQTQQAQDAIARQAELNDLEEQNLATQQEISREQQNQSRIQEEQERRRRREELLGALGSQRGDNEEARAQLEQIRENAELARRAGAIDRGTFRNIRSTIDDVDSALRQDDDVALLRRSLREQNPLFNQLLSQVGRSDIVGLSGFQDLGAPSAAEQLRQGMGINVPNLPGQLATQTGQQQQSMNGVAQAIAQEGQRISSQLNRLTSEIRRLATTPQNLTIERGDDMGVLTQALNTFSQQKMRAAGIG